MSSFWRTPDGVFGAHGGSAVHDFSHAKSAEGYGVYAFSGSQDHRRRSMGQLPPGVTIEQVIANMDQYLTIQDGIQVAKTEVQAPIVETLDTMTFSAEGSEVGATVRGTANFMMFDWTGTDFASEYLSQGYAILVDKASVQGGVPRLIMTMQPQVITDNAFEGGPYAVAAGPPELIAAAGRSVTPPVPPTPGPGPTPPGPLTPPAQPAATGTPDWVVPAVIGVGALAGLAVLSSVMKGQR